MCKTVGVGRSLVHHRDTDKIIRIAAIVKIGNFIIRTELFRIPVDLDPSSVFRGFLGVIPLLRPLEKRVICVFIARRRNVHQREHRKAQKEAENPSYGCSGSFHCFVLQFCPAYIRLLCSSCIRYLQQYSNTLKLCFQPAKHVTALSGCRMFSVTVLLPCQRPSS